MARRTPFQFDITAVNRTGPAWRGVENSIQRTQGAAQALQRTIGLLAGAAGIGLSIRAFTQMTSRALQTAEALTDLSDRVGVSVEFLQTMRLAADQNGSSASEFDDSISRLNRRLGLFITTGAGPAATAFRQLGLDARITNGELTNSEQVFNAFVVELQKIDDVAQQAALASQLFGDRSGPQLVGMLRRGTDGLQAYQDALRETGRLMGDDVARQGAELNARLRDIRATFDDRMANVILENAGAIAQLAEAMGDVAEWGVKAAASAAQFYRAVIQGQSLSADGAAQSFDIQAVQARLERGEFRGPAGQIQLGLTLESVLGRDTALQVLNGLLGGGLRESTAGVVALGYTEQQLQMLGDQLQTLTRSLADFGEIRRDLSYVPGIGWVDQNFRVVTPPPRTEPPPRRRGSAPPPGLPGSTTPTTDPRALPPITETIHVGMQTVDRFQGQLARYFSDGDLLPALDAVGEATERTATRLDNVRERYDRFNLTLEDVALNGIAAVEDALTDLIMGAEGGFRDLARSVVAMLVRMAVQNTISGMLGSINFGGGRAMGGPVGPGKTYRVGERGPEMFTPSVPGEITPIERGGGAGGKVHIVIEAAEGPMFSARVAEISAPLVMEGVEISVARATAEVGADISRAQMTGLR